MSPYIFYKAGGINGKEYRKDFKGSPIRLGKQVYRAGRRKKFGVSKSTFHADVTYKLKDVDKETYEKVQRLMDYHFSIRHLRGGEATKRKYKQSKSPV